MLLIGYSLNNKTMTSYLRQPKPFNHLMNGFLTPHNAIFILNLVLRSCLLKILFNNLGQQTPHDNPVSKTFTGLDSNRKNVFWLFVIRVEIARLPVPGSLQEEDEIRNLFLIAFFRLQV